MNEIDGDLIVKIFSYNKPQLVWEMDAHTFHCIRFAKSALGEYLWVPNTEFPDRTGRLMGIDINISDEIGIRLVTVHRKTKHSKVIELTE